MPHVTVYPGSTENPVYQVGGKSFVFFRNPRPDAVDPQTGERYTDVIVFWVGSEEDKIALVQDETTPFFTTRTSTGTCPCSLRGSRIGELSRDELAEVVQDAWLARASKRRAADWLRDHAPGGRLSPDADSPLTNVPLGLNVGRRSCRPGGDRARTARHHGGVTGTQVQPQQSPAENTPPHGSRAGPRHRATHRRRARRPPRPGRRRRRPARRRRDRPVRRPLPQGGHGQPRRRPAAHAGGAAALPARAGGAPGRGARLDPVAGQARRRAGDPHPRGRLEGPPGGHLPAVQAQAAHQGDDRPGERPRAAGRRAARRPDARPDRDGRGLRHRERPRRRGGARGRPRDPRRAVLRRRRPHRRPARAHVEPRAGSSPPSARARRPRARSSPTTSTFSEPFTKLPSHRILAVFRGEKEEVLDVTLDPGDGSDSDEPVTDYERTVAVAAGIRDEGRAADKWLAQVVRWTWRTRILLGLQVDLRVRLRTVAEEAAIAVFAANLRDLLLAAPAGTRATMGLDPGLRTGVKVAVVDATGKVVATDTIYPHEPRRDWNGALATLTRLAVAHDVDLIAIGNGTASRETDKLAGELVAANPGLKMTKVMVSEAGASVYSASAYASAELPGLDVSLRGAVSIARRLQDPLAELVKIDPKSIGVGPVPARPARVVAVALAGRGRRGRGERRRRRRQHRLGAAAAPRLGDHRGAGRRRSWRTATRTGPYPARTALSAVPRLGPKAFEQCAGFLRIRGGDDPLDVSGVHPEAYPVVRRIVAKAGGDVATLLGNAPKLRVAQAAAVRRRPVRAADGDRHPRRAGEARPRPAPGVPHRDLRRGRAQDRGPAARDGAGGRGHERRRVRGVRRRRRAPGRARARLGDVAAVRQRPARRRQVRRGRAGEGAGGRRGAQADLADPAAGRRAGRGREAGPRRARREADRTEQGREQGRDDERPGRPGRDGQGGQGRGGQAGGQGAAARGRSGQQGRGAERGRAPAPAANNAMADALRRAGFDVGGKQGADRRVSGRGGSGSGPSPSRGPPPARPARSPPRPARRAGAPPSGRAP